MRIPLAKGAWVEHEPEWIGADEALTLLTGIREELDWEQREIVVLGRRILQPRLIAWAGDIAYRYSGLVLEARPFTPHARRLLLRVRDRARVPFNHVLVNRYRSGGDSMGFHADAEPELGPDPVVASVSLGAPRRLVLKPRRSRAGAPHAFDLGAGCLFIMGGTCQRHYVHGVPRQPRVEGERISLTFRWLHRAPSLATSGADASAAAAPIPADAASGRRSTRPDGERGL
jgi:alkylated DNA repair dioxygenase AlkB